MYRGNEDVNTNQTPSHISILHPSRKKIRCVKIIQMNTNKHINMATPQYSM